MKRVIAILLCLTFIICSAVDTVPINAADSVNRNVMIASFKKNKVKYVNSDFNYNYKKNVDWKFKSIIGYGRKRNLKLSKKCVFFKIDYTTAGTNYIKTSRNDFQKLLKSYTFKKVYFNGFTKDGYFIEVPYYYGLACRLVIKNKKIFKVYQLKQ